MRSSSFNRRVSVAALCLGLSAFAVASGDPADNRDSPATRAPESLADLQWVSGDWVGTFAGHPFEALYSSTEGATILGASKMLGEEPAEFFEFERIYRVDGKTFYVPYPGGNRSVTFELVDFDPKAPIARFVNQSHDFPTEVRFESPQPDRLTITLSGPNGEKGPVRRAVLRRR